MDARYSPRPKVRVGLIGMTTLERHLQSHRPAETVHSVDDVIAQLAAIDESLANDDGLKWFNLLYLVVTRGVRQGAAGIGWENPQWLERLDVIFAQHYFSALHHWCFDRAATPRCWRPLLEARQRSEVMRVQFALAGINAHINHDLPIALVQTCRVMGVSPLRSGAEHRDYQRVNDILESAQDEAKQFVATGIVGLIDEELGRLDDRVANWGVRKARETAWSNGRLLWRLNCAPRTRAEFLRNLDRLVNLASQGMLVPTSEG